ncbi:MFS transporter [Actibacterium sp. XHP0104]|uniref:MFS transporter n=1 Tax=Actibacterium sp. XHP0104 TaxID=2984335 RepID=UPI0021E7D01C|nr:MFS transporter [Actibacterium sp. XHP0104]MCV2880823.1 MFS transporter [Actibacterium sp. XHP0104]
MIKVLGSSWALLLGVLLLMIGNGLQGTLLGLRGEIEGFSTFEISLVMSGYFLGFLGGSRLAPEMIRRVGHVRVFAALASFISAALILFPVVADPWVWIGLRIIVGFCFSGVYVTSESWLNNSASNETRGQALSAYMIVQMLGLVAAQAILTLGDPSGFVLFIIPSVLVSIAFAPILLSAQPMPAFGRTQPLSIARLYRISPLGCVGMFLVGGIYSALLGMASVYGVKAGLSVPEISTFIGAMFVGGLLLQYPIGWLSDRMDRRHLIFGAAVIGALGALAGLAMGGVLPALVVASAVIGGMTNPLYALLIAHTNDFIEHEDMAAASGGLIFLNGMGAVAGPLITGWIMGQLGPGGFFVFIAALMGALAAYAAWRMTRRPAPDTDHTGAYAHVMAASSPVAVELAQEVFQDGLDEAAEERNH